MTAAGATSARPRRIRPFTPSQEAPTELSARTVGRDGILATLQARLHSAATSRTRPHTLLVGPRGAGKTHMLEVALHRALQDPLLSSRLAVARIDEDVVGLTRYADLLRECLAALGAGTRPSTGTSLEAALDSALGDRVLLLVIENLDRLFRAIGAGGQRDLRGWIETSGKVMLLATAPLLFPGVTDRSEPWYGGLAITHLAELDVEEGRELLIRIAEQAGDDSLSEFLKSDAGRARLQAVNALAGGSPRVWMILSECMTVEALDPLLPAVEAMLEGLVPYYQQLLWELPGNEQRLIRALAADDRAGATVAELAEATDLRPNLAAATLGRLAERKWVRSEKRPGMDQRTTWYRLREPLLRHHLQYRSTRGEPLIFIVEILRAWFDPNERRAKLRLAPPASEAERLIVRSLRDQQVSFDAADNDRDLDALLVEARRWAAGEESHRRTRDAGALIDVAVTALRSGSEDAGRVIRARGLAEVRDVGNRLVLTAASPVAETSEADRMGILLAQAAAETRGGTHAVLELVSACWDGRRRPETARDRLNSLISGEPLDIPDSLRLDIRQEAAFWTGQAGDPASARDQLAVLVPDRLRILGRDDPDTLTTRHHLAHWTGAAGDPAAARDQSADLLKDYRRVLGPDHPGTLITRVSLALWTGEAGMPADAADLALRLLIDLERSPTTGGRLMLVTRTVLRSNVVRLLTTPDRQPGGPRIAEGGLAHTLEAALSGSAEALARLPAELADIVREIRADRAEPVRD